MGKPRSKKRHHRLVIDDSHCDADSRRATMPYWMGLSEVPLAASKLDISPEMGLEKSAKKPLEVTTVLVEQVVPKKIPYPRKAGKSEGGLSVSTNALDISVARTLERILEGLDVTASTAQIVESFLWTLLGWRKGNRWATPDFGRFVSSMRQTTQLLASKRDAGDSDQTFCKSWTNYLMCRAIGDLSGDAPRPKEPLFVGFVWRGIKRALARKDASFFYSLLQSKRFWPKLGVVKERENLADMKSRLCSPPVRQLGDEVIDEITKTCNMIFRKLTTPTKLSPSPSACYQATVREGGAYSLFEGMNEPNQIEISILGSLRAYSLEFERWRTRTFETAVQESEPVMLGDNQMRCKVQLIAEPSKFRGITKGNGFVYTRLQPLQGTLLSAWKHRKESTMEGDLDEKVRALSSSPEPFWCSGDFKAATDTIDQIAVLSASSAVDRYSRTDLASQSLMPSVLEFPDGEVGLQIGGQLMGHPLSFPLLCGINLAMYRLAVRRYGRRFSLHASTVQRLLDTVLVNGDDILFKCTLALYKIWKETVQEIGLIVSPGKNYLSKDIAVINSRMYYAPDKMRFKRLGYINLKLIKGFSLKSGISAATPEVIGKDISDMVKHCPQAISTVPAAFRRFKPVGWQPNWYLPVHLGGYGVDLGLSPKVDLGVTREQRMMAAFFHSDPTLQLYSKIGPRLRTLLSKYSWFQNAHWVTRALTETEQDWIGRLAQINFAMAGPDHSSPEFIQLRLKRSRRLKPMSLFAIGEHWDDVAVLAQLPTCPALGRVGF